MSAAMNRFIPYAQSNIWKIVIVPNSVFNSRSYSNSNKIYNIAISKKQSINCPVCINASGNCDHQSEVISSLDRNYSEKHDTFSGTQSSPLLNQNLTVQHPTGYSLPKNNSSPSTSNSNKYGYYNTDVNWNNLHQYGSSCGKMHGSVVPRLLNPPALATSPSDRRALHTNSRQHAIYVINTEDEFKSKVMNSSLPVVVNFHADWCEPCHALKPLLEDLADKFEGRMHLAEVKVDDHVSLLQAFEVTAVPAVVGVVKGQVTEKFVGLVSESEVRAFVDAMISE